MAKVAQASTEAPLADADTAPLGAETQGVTEGEASGGGPPRIGTSTETQPTPAPTFTQQEYGVMVVLVAVFVLLVGSLAGRRGS